MTENTTNDNLLCFYGTLVGNAPRQKQLGIDTLLEFVCEDQLQGTMYELMTCPGLQPHGENKYRVEVYRSLDPVKTREVLDAFEDYYPNDEENSRFLLRPATTLINELPVNVYYISDRGVPEGSAIIEDKSWIEFVQRTNKQLPNALPSKYWLDTF